MSPHLTAAFTEVSQDSRGPKAAPTHHDMLKSRSQHPSHMPSRPRFLTSASTCATVSREGVLYLEALAHERQDGVRHQVRHAPHREARRCDCGAILQCAIACLLADKFAP